MKGGRSRAESAVSPRLCRIKLCSRGFLSAQRGALRYGLAYKIYKELQRFRRCFLPPSRLMSNTCQKRFNFDIVRFHLRFVDVFKSWKLLSRPIVTCFYPNFWISHLLFLVSVSQHSCLPDQLPQSQKEMVNMLFIFTFYLFLESTSYSKVGKIIINALWSSSNVT